MKLIWLLLLLICSNQVFAADDIQLNNPLKLLVINPVQSEILLSDIEKRMINKVVLKICAKQNGYEISMGEIGIAREARFNIFDVTLTLSGSDSNMTITGTLLDERNKILVKKITKTNGERLHVMRNVEDVMNGLFPKGNRLHSAK